jgi:antitoxin (DNA-binding transcriptional repressor) of toxin-antitoxin stability system
MKTITVGAFEAKTHLSGLLARVAKGDQVIITKHEKPVARLSRFQTGSTLTRTEVLGRFDELAGAVKPGPETAKDLITAGRKL